MGVNKGEKLGEKVGLSPYGCVCAKAERQSIDIRSVKTGFIAEECWYKLLIFWQFPKKEIRGGLKFGEW